MRDELDILRQGSLNTVRDQAENLVGSSPRRTERETPAQPRAAQPRNTEPKARATGGVTRPPRRARTAASGDGAEAVEVPRNGRRARPEARVPQTPATPSPPAPTRPTRAPRSRPEMPADTDRGLAEITPIEDSPTPSGNGGGGRGSGGGRGPGRSWRRRWSEGRPSRPPLRKLRLLLIVVGLAALALVSTVFGIMLAVASDLPQLENVQRFAAGRTSYLYDDYGRAIGPFLPPHHEVIDTWKQFSPSMIDAIIAVEDKRFWSDPGVDLHGVARAVLADVTGGATQGASTIAEQFVKNALNESNNRTIFEKLREAALAFQLSHKWKKTKILTEYLNSIYFGNGAYGVESAARVYFGKTLGYDPNAPSDGQVSRCGDSTTKYTVPSCASLLQPWQAALLAGMVANPSAFNPIAHPVAAKARRDLVLQDMLEQHFLTQPQFEVDRARTLPTAVDLEQPQEPTAAPYFTSWLAPQILHAMGYGQPGVPASVAEYRAYYGGLKIKTTLDLPMQHAADQAISQDLPYSNRGVVASLVAIDNRTGQVRAMVGGPVINGQEDYQQYPFNLATQAERQPGSAFKPFTLAVALESGFGPSSVFLSAPAQFIVPNSGGKEVFDVRNFGNSYSGPISLQEATDISDNSVFSRLGIIGLADHGGTKRIAHLAHVMGIRTPVSHNYAMILGGLKVGVSPLDMAHAYETLATNGKKVYDPKLGDFHQGPTGIAEIKCGAACPQNERDLVDHPHYKRIIPASIAVTERDMLEGPVAAGTATAAAIPGVVVAGKTGTTTNYGDAWFVGWTPELTVAVWVGYPNSTTSMSTLFNGGPVEGGTYPAIIWRDFMTQALQILADEQAAAQGGSTTPSPISPTSGSSSSSSSSSGSSTVTSPSSSGRGSGSQSGGSSQTSGGGNATSSPTPGAGGNSSAGGGTGSSGTGSGTGSSSTGSGTSSGTGSGSGTSSGSGSGSSSGSSGSGSSSGGSGIGIAGQ